jgi:phosphoketolase
MIILRSPKGWTGPKVVDGKKSYRPHELFDTTGRLIPDLSTMAPTGERRMSANPHANGGLLLRDLRLPDFRDYAVTVPQPGATDDHVAPDGRVMEMLSEHQCEGWLEGYLLTGLGARAAYAQQAIREKLIEHKQYITKYGEDMPDIRNWTWSPASAEKRRRGKSVAGSRRKRA